MPEHELDVVALGEFRQLIVDAGSDIPNECLQERKAALVRGCSTCQIVRIGTPVHIAVALAPRIDSRTAQTLLDHIERPLPQPLQLIIDHGIVSPSLWLLAIVTRGERFKTSFTRVNTTTETPLAVAVAIALDIRRQFHIVHPAVGIALSSHQHDRHLRHCNQRQNNKP